MKSKVQNWLMMAIAVMMLCGAVACSDDAPNKIDSESWRLQMDTIYEVAVNPAYGPMMGDQFDNFGFHIAIKDKNGKDLLQNPEIANSDYYIEYNGQRYMLGDSVPFPTQNALLSVDYHYSGVMKILYVNFTRWDLTYFDHEPIDYTFSFVWPSKNIRKTMRVYVEFNQNVKEEIEAKTQELVQNGQVSALVPAAYICRFVDDKVYKPKFFDTYILTVE